MLFIKKLRDAVGKLKVINYYVNIQNKTKSIEGKKLQVWFGIREKILPPDYERFKRICENEHVNLSTSEEEYTYGADDKGILFCPAFSTLQGASTSAKSIESLMSEWRQG